MAIYKEELRPSALNRISLDMNPGGGSAPAAPEGETFDADRWLYVFSHPTSRILPPTKISDLTTEFVTAAKQLPTVLTTPMTIPEEWEKQAVHDKFMRVGRNLAYYDQLRPFEEIQGQPSGDLLAIGLALAFYDHPNAVKGIIDGFAANSHITYTDFATGPGQLQEHIEAKRLYLRNQVDYFANGGLERTNSDRSPRRA